MYLFSVTSIKWLDIRIITFCWPEQWTSSLNGPEQCPHYRWQLPNASVHLKDPSPTQREHFIHFRLKTTASDLEGVTPIPATSHSGLQTKQSPLPNKASRSYPWTTQIERVTKVCATHSKQAWFCTRNAYIALALVIQGQNSPQKQLLYPTLP